MILLAIDTATEMCSAALWVDGKLYQQSSVQPRLHAELILPFVDEVLTEAGIEKKQLQGLVVGQGPGAFTGVRIGVAVIQGMALALKIPVVAVSNLQTLAYSAYQKLKTSTEKTILVATDARMKEVYWAKFRVVENEIKEISKQNVGAANQVKLDGVDAYIGSGFSVYSELSSFAENYPMAFDTNVYSSAKDMLLMVKDNFYQLAQPIETIEPVYLREP